ncbi:MAG TPA: circadian clock protein KaiC [Solirubrobacteraceae bacterium]|nr:circadian clock protein KaiC [Solirubrobacteraceae bacterium]
MLQDDESPSAAPARHALSKSPTGIHGLDEITQGGLPRGRTTLVCGGPGCGKTLLAMQFLVRGAVDFDEPGVFIAFEESTHELKENVASLGWDLADLEERGLVAVDHVRLEAGEIQETGPWDLDGLFIRLGAALEAVGARRIVLDTIETLFGSLGDEARLRSELRRLFRWLNDRGVTAIVTGERGAGTLTRHGLEEYVSDCVVVLEHKTHKQISTRTLRVLKYRGSLHGPDEYPFLIDDTGLSVFPASSMGLSYATTAARVSSGVSELDRMLGDGLYRGSTVLVSGTAGSGKTSLAARFLEAGCQRGERGVLFAFEESPDQIIRNMRSVGIDLEPWVAAGQLRIDAVRPAAYGLETHLARMHRVIEEFQPTLAVLDPVSGLDGEAFELKSVISRKIDDMKGRGITAMMTTLAQSADDGSGLGVSSLIDTWIDLSNIELDGERNRGVNILKSRGMAHSNQVREFQLTDNGIYIRDVYAGDHGVLMGSARRAQEARDRAEKIGQEVAADAKRRLLATRRSALEAQIAAIRDQLESETLELQAQIEAGERRERQLEADRASVAVGRTGAPASGNGVAGHV